MLRRTSMIVLGWLLASCASAYEMNRHVSDAVDGSCQSECHERHRDSLYDENRCLESCRAPE